MEKQAKLNVTGRVYCSMSLKIIIFSIEIKSCKTRSSIVEQNRSVHLWKRIYFGISWLWSADRIFKCLSRSSYTCDRALARHLKKNGYGAINKYVAERKMKNTSKQTQFSDNQDIANRSNHFLLCLFGSCIHRWSTFFYYHPCHTYDNQLNDHLCFELSL